MTTNIEAEPLAPHEPAIHPSRCPYTRSVDTVSGPINQLIVRDEMGAALGLEQYDHSKTSCFTGQPS